MYRIHKVALISIAIAMMFLTWVCDLKIEKDLGSDILSLVGILFGFTITAAMAMRGSGFLAKQSKIVDSKASGIQKTNAQRLCDYIQASCIADLALIVALIAPRIALINSALSRIVDTIIMCLISIAMVLSYLVLRVVMRFMREV